MTTDQMDRQTTQDEDDLFGQSAKNRSISFDTRRLGPPPIEYRSLTVLERARKIQDRDVDSGEPKYWNGPDGKPDETQPKFKWVIKVQMAPGFTPDKDIVEEDGEDDGVRFLYISGPASAPKGQRGTRAAFVAALRAAGVKAAIPGGVFNRFAFVAEGKAESRAKNPPKFYEATYTPPAPGMVDESGVMGNGDSGAARPDPNSDEPPF